VIGPRTALISLALCAGLSACLSSNRAAVSSQPVAAAPARDSNGPHYDGCPVFPPGDSAYNRDLRAAPIDPGSQAYIASLGSNDSWDDDRIEYLNVADGDPSVAVRSKVAWHTMPPQPWQPAYRIEAASDAHSFVLDRRACHLYELYQTTFDGFLSAYSGGNWDLRRPFVAGQPGTSSAVASGLSMFAGSVKYSELASGQVLHALFLIVPYHTLAQWSFVRPASATDRIAYAGTAARQLPYGARLRLRPDYPEAEAGPQAAAVLHALKTYGAIGGDTGCCYKFVYMNDLQTENAFNFPDLETLHRIKPADWQVIQLPAIQTLAQ
jgi:hypothetical protein